MNFKGKTYFDVCEKYPQIPQLIILKIDMQRRGYVMTERASRAINLKNYQVRERSFSRELDGNYPVSFILRDGTSVITRPNLNQRGGLEPFLIDYIDDCFVVCFNGELIEEIFLWEKPNYYDKFTTKGTPMWQVINSRPQRLEVNPFQYCDFCTKGKGCKFCEIASTFHNANKPLFLNIDEIEETFYEALTELGRYTSITLTGGTILSGPNIFDDEVDLYIRILQRMGRIFSERKFPSQLIGNAYNVEQLKRLYNETGLLSYTADIEVLNKNLFSWICPGKNQYVGYDEWKLRLIQAVDIFGRGYVNTGIVCGVEFAKPYGFIDEEEACFKLLKEAEDLFRNGVSVLEDRT